MDFNKALSILKSNSTWLKVEDENCIHSFEGDFYFILCKYTKDGQTYMRLRVDNNKTGDLEILKNDYLLGSSQFSYLDPIYQNGKTNSTPALRRTNY